MAGDSKIGQEGILPIWEQNFSNKGKEAVPDISRIFLVCSVKAILF